MTDRYKIVRFYRDSRRKRRTIKTGLTLAEAKKHCNDPKTAKSFEYFDGYTQMK